MRSSLGLIMAPSPPHARRIQARPTASPPGTWPLGVEQWEKNGLGAKIPPYRLQCLEEDHLNYVATLTTNYGAATLQPLSSATGQNQAVEEAFLRKCFERAGAAALQLNLSMMSFHRDLALARCNTRASTPLPFTSTTPARPTEGRNEACICSS
jgi:hypothetical protein